MPDNNRRADRIAYLLRDYLCLLEQEHDEPLPELVTDLLTDLRHFAAREELDLSRLIIMSGVHFDEERPTGPPYRSIIHPKAPPRPTLPDCPVCQKDHTSWTGCWLAEVGGTLQDRGWSTAEIVEAIGKIPDIQEIYDAHIGPAVDAVEAYLPTQEELEQKEKDDFERYGPSEAQLDAYHGRRS
jgi:hypothetical protein